MTDRSDKGLRVSAVSWDRIWLQMTVDDNQGYISSDGSFFLIDRDDKKIAELKKADTDEGVILRLNITNIGGCRCIESGEYKVGYSDSDRGETGTVLSLSEEVQISSEDANKRFAYGDGSKSCDINLSGSEKELIITVDYNKVFSAKSTCRKALRSAAAKVFASKYKKGRRKHKINDEKPVILLLYETDIDTATNLRVLKDAMKRRGLEKEYEIRQMSWNRSEDGKTGFSHQLNVVEGLARADCIFIDESVTILNWLKLDKDVKLTQLWHAGVGFKSAGYARWGHVPSPEKFSCHRQYTCGVCGSKKTAPVFSEVWGIDESMILPLGMPRIDEFLDEDHRRSSTGDIHNRYPVTATKKVILFAPTYRGKNWRDAHYPYEKIDFRGLYEACGDEYVCFFKMHPFVKKAVPIPDEYLDRLMDVSDYPSINDLMYVTELLITDYSSDIYEFSLLGKPMLFYAFDEEEYAADRGFHLDYKKSTPGKVVQTMDELISAIKEKDFEKKKVSEYRNRCFDHVDTNACDRIIDKVILSKT